ncbi:MAG TPA: alanine acetyltransferase [Sporichthyaceae bacterium]|nr:alanine acetyltransferase [Sporichthyaceae bacterium]
MARKVETFALRGPGPRIQEPTDAVIRVTSTAICGSDVHLYEVLGPWTHPREDPARRTAS